MDEECCDSLISGQSQTNDLLTRMLKLWQSGFRLVPIDGLNNPPDLGGGDCAPAFFDHDTDETDEEVLEIRRKALCITIERYIKAIVLGALVEMGAPSFLVDYVQSVFVPDLPVEFTKLNILYPYAFDGLSVFILMADTALTFDLLCCLMLDALEGDINNTFNNFKLSIPEETGDLPSGLIPVADLVRRSNQDKLNFTLFNEALSKANDEDLSEYECPCADIPEGCETITLVNSQPIIFPDTIITPVEGHAGTFRIQNSSTDTTGFGVCGAGVEDENGCCFDTVPNPEGLDTQGVSQSRTYYCDGTDTGVIPGGGGGNCVIKYQWDQGGSTPVDTYITVVPHVGEVC